MDSLFLEQTQKAAQALIKHESITITKKNVTPEGDENTPLNKEIISSELDETCIWLMLGLGKMTGKATHKPIRLPIPHSFRASDPSSIVPSSICLITKDPQREWKDKIQEMIGGESPLKTRITKVIGISKLRQKFKQYEAKRQLCKSFDLFLADEALLPLLPKLLGKKFFSSKKLPVPVSLNKKDLTSLEDELNCAINSTYLHQTGGNCLGIRVGMANQSPSHLAENVRSILRELSSKLPGGISNIKTLHLKTPNSHSIPIFERSSE